MTSTVEEPRDSPNVGEQNKGEVKLPSETLAAFGGDELRSRVFYEKYALRDAQGRQVEKVPDDLWRRVAKELASAEQNEEKRKEWTAKFHWLLQDYRFVPGGRILFGAGQSRKSTLLNCLDGDTEVLIRESIEYKTQQLGYNNSLILETSQLAASVSKAKVRDIVGKEVEVLTPEGWKTVVFRSYGKQLVYLVSLRNGDEFIATANHEWPVFYNMKQKPSRVTTLRLKGKSLFVSLPNRPEINRDYHDGVVHGIIYGDGSRNSNAKTYVIYLFGGQRDLVQYLKDYGHVTEYSGRNPTLQGAFFVGGIRSRHDLKEVPSDSMSASYWYGFICGLIATDGHCSANGQVGMDQHDLGDLRRIREQIARIGMFPNRIFVSRKLNPYNGQPSPLYRLNLSKFSLVEGDLLRNDHKERFAQRRITSKVGNHVRVTNVTPLSEEREVYCCTEPVTHTFTIGNGILTGNCYFFKIREDSIEAIFDWCKEAARTYSFGGGVGTDISVLRPRGAPVNNSAIYSSGSVSFMELLSTTTGTIGQAGRRGALMITIRVDHPDVMDFVNVKSDLKKVNYANISVKITDDFMRAVETDGDFLLHFKNDKVEVNRTVRAKEVWKSLIRGAWQSAEPGVLFWDTIKKDSTTEYNGMEVQGVNPCSEQTLENYGCCCLGSVNLSAFIKEPFTERASIDWDSLTRATQFAVRFLDNVLDYNADRHPLGQQKTASLLSRRIGVGITGLGDMLIKLGLKYDDDSTIGFVDHLFERIKNVIYDYSTDLANEKGSFPAFDAEKHLAQPFVARLDEKVKGKIRTQGIRNAAITTIPPVGSGSILAGCSSGVEPVFALYYTRRSKSLSAGEFKVFHPLVKEYMSATGARDEAQLPNYFVTSHDIRPEMRVKMQATIQKHIDTAISSTVNLPQEITPEEVEKIYLLAWKSGCFLKGNDIYTRDGLKDISEIVSGDSVLTHDGRYYKVTETYHLPAEVRRFVRLDIQGMEDLVATAEHPILVLRPTAKHWQNKSWAEQEHQLMWLKITDIQTGDHVLQPKFRFENERIEEITISDYVDCLVRDGKAYPYRTLPWKKSKRVIAAHSSGIRNTVQIDEDLVWFIGWFVAEGHFDGSSYVRMTLNPSEASVADKLERIVLEKFGLSARRELVRSGGTSLRIKWGSHVFSQFLSQQVGRGAKNKHLPVWFARLSPDLLEMMVKAWSSGDSDGTANGGVTTSKRLWREVFMAQSELSHLTMRVSARKSGLFQVTQGTSNYTGKEWKGFLCYRVKGKSEFLGSEPVYNFAVEGADSYVVNGVTVHNCKGITVYREGSREGILETNKVAKKVEQPRASFDRPRMMEGRTLKLKLPQGGLYLTANLVNGELKEVFVTLGKSGGDEKADAEALGRLISLYLQHGGDIKSAISTLKGIKGKYVSWDEGTQLLSIPDAVAKALELLTLNHVVKESSLPMQAETSKRAPQGGTCPDCHESSLIFENGCYTCANCGYSKCE